MIMFTAHLRYIKLWRFRCVCCLPPMAACDRGMARGHTVTRGHSAITPSPTPQPPQPSSLHCASPAVAYAILSCPSTLQPTQLSLQRMG